MEHIYVVTYDISDPVTWRAVYRTMQGYGEWLQLSVFQCRLDRARHAELIADLDRIIDHGDDHVIIFDMGPALGVRSRVVSLGKSAYEPVSLRSLVV